MRPTGHPKRQILAMLDQQTRKTIRRHMADSQRLRLETLPNHLQHAVYVGDTDGDYKATREAGIPFVHAAYGFGQTENPDYTITSPMDLVTLFVPEN